MLWDVIDGSFSIISLACVLSSRCGGWILETTGDIRSFFYLNVVPYSVGWIVIQLHVCGDVETLVVVVTPSFNEGREVRLLICGFVETNIVSS